MTKKNAHDFYDEALIKLRRAYGKDEAVAGLSKLLKDKEIELGKAKAEILHLEDELKFKKDERQTGREARIKIRKDEVFQSILKENNKLRQKVKEQRNTISDLIVRLNKKS